MRKDEVFAMSFTEVCYTELLCTMYRFRDELVKITLKRERNTKGILCAVVDCHLQSKKSGNTAVKTFSLYQDDYLWFLNSIQADFPEIVLEDLTADEDKPKGA